MESRRWLVQKMGEAGLTAEIDGVGTVIGRSALPGPALLIGSHSDTQPTGGWLDGALGVIYGLEVARALGEKSRTRRLPVDVVSWIDEEGTFFSCLGSHSFCESLAPDVFDTSRDAGGRTLGEALRSAGLWQRPRARLQGERYRGYLEAHIEQGPYLEEAGKRIGVVTGIVGIRNLTISASGQQNHAGTTPMHRRKDAGRALIELAYRVHQAFPEHAGPRTVWTIGWVEFEPGAPSIVPGRASMNLQFRDADEAKLDELQSLALEMVEAANRATPVEVSVERPHDPSRPASMDEGFQRHIADAAERHAAGSWMHMPSAAGHDAQVLANRMPSAMLFVPSIGGISHAFEEDSHEDDIVLGCQVLATAAASILAE